MADEKEKKLKKRPTAQNRDIRNEKKTFSQQSIQIKSYYNTA